MFIPWGLRSERFTATLREVVGLTLGAADSPHLQGLPGTFLPIHYTSKAALSLGIILSVVGEKDHK